MMTQTKLAVPTARPIPPRLTFTHDEFPQRGTPSWHWSCPAGHHSRKETPAARDHDAAQHARVCHARPLSFHTPTTPKCPDFSDPGGRA